MGKRRERSLLIIGAGGLGQDVAEIAVMTGRYTKIAFLDDNMQKQNSRQFPIIGNVAELPKFCGEYEYAIAAIGNNQKRMELHAQIKECKYEIPILIHPSAIVHPLASLSPGVIIRALCYVSMGVDVGEATLLNIGCKIDHNCVIGEGTHIPMGAVVRNEVNIPPMSSFSSNAVIE